jgi:hypothetical protein
VDESPVPCGLNQRATDVPTDREVQVEAMAAGMPLGHPHVRQWLAPKSSPEGSKELASVSPDLPRVETARPGVRQRAKPV